MTLLSLVYLSTAVDAMTDDALAEILQVSRDNNSRSGVTGLLLYRGGRFLQLLEGESDAVEDRMQVIEADPRHTAVTRLLTGPVTERQFPDWTMAFATVPDSAASRIPGHRRSIADLFTTTSDRYEDFLPALRELMRWYQGHPREHS